MPGRSMGDFMCEPEKLRPLLQKICAGEDLHDEPLCGVLGGRTMRFLVSARLVELGGKQQVLCLAVDDSRQQQTEERLQQSRRSIRTITSCSPDGICILRGSWFFTPTMLLHHVRPQAVSARYASGIILMLRAMRCYAPCVSR
jgi:PAS domain-containing protein